MLVLSNAASVFANDNSLKEQARGLSSGSSGAWICRSPGGTLRWAELVDLFEARAIFGLTIPKTSDLSVRRQAEVMVVTIAAYDTALYTALMDEIKEVEAELFPTDIELAPPGGHDFIGRPQASECAGGELKYETVTQAIAGSRILQSRSAFAALGISSLTNQAAVWVHEAFSSLNRKRSLGMDPERIRALVGYLFSTAELEAYVDLLPRLTPAPAPVPDPTPVPQPKDAIGALQKLVSRRGPYFTDNVWNCRMKFLFADRNTVYFEYLSPKFGNNCGNRDYEDGLIAYTCTPMRATCDGQDVTVASVFRSDWGGSHVMCSKTGIASGEDHIYLTPDILMSGSFHRFWGYELRSWGTNAWRLGSLQGNATHYQVRSMAP